MLKAMSLLKKIQNLFKKTSALASQHTPQPLKLCELNAENLFISLDYYSGEDLEHLSESQWRKLALPQLRYKQKPISKIWGLASAIADINPDILMLIEVGGKESLEHFNHHFLKDAYILHFVETNSQRSIDLAFLVKKDFRFHAQAISNREVPVHINSHPGASIPSRFSRDVAELHLRDGSQLKLIILLTHLKSKISTERDFQGRDLRQAEAEALAALYIKIAGKNPDVPMIVGGDLNSDLTSAELKALAKTDLTDFHEYPGTPMEDRISLVHFDYQGNAHPQTLDYLLVSPHLKEKIIREESSTYRYKSFYNIPHPLPSTVHQRYHMPSDHFPLILTLLI